MPVYTDAAAWDMRQGYFQTLEEALRLAFEARVNKDAPSWLDILDGVYSRVRPFFNPTEAGRFDDALEKAKNALYQEFDQDEESEESMSRTIDDLNQIERDLLHSLHSHGLLVPRRTDNRHAASEGVGE